MTVFIVFCVIVFILLPPILMARKAVKNRIFDKLDEPCGGVTISLYGLETFIDKTLTAEMYYYRSLPTEKKPEFIRRVMHFNKTTTFYPQSGLTLSERHLVLISATFVQITFGLHNSLLDYLNHIKLYPAHYMDLRTQRQYKGEVDVAGMICLSWEDFELGLRDATDGRNVGLHELAHAFAIEIIEKDAHYHHLLMTLKPIYLRAKYEINNPDARHNLLREYGYYNMHEYFAVATEVFFENPGYLLHSGSPLYRELCDLFNQNPLAQYELYESSKNQG